MNEKETYRIGLGKHFINRARWIFFILLLITLVNTVAAIYTNAQTGMLDKQIVRPASFFFKELLFAFEENKALYEPIPLITGQTAITSTTEVNTETSTDTADGKTIIQYVYPPTNVPNLSDQNANQSSNTWPSYEERVQKMQEEADVRWQEAQSQQAALRADSQSKLDAFSALNEKCRQEFHDNQGTFVSDECKNR